MKTRKEVEKHLAQTGYTKNAANCIGGYLIGAGICAQGDKFDIKAGEKKFPDFLKWFESPDKIDDEAVFCSIVEDMVIRIIDCESLEEVKRLDAQVDLLIKMAEDYFKSKKKDEKQDR